MKIQRIYIPCYRNDQRLLQCCVASIRYWYPKLPISIIKDESHGPFDTAALERYWGVDVFPSERRRFGLGFGKLEPLFKERRERCFLLDADTIFVGRVLDRFETRDEEFVVDDPGSTDNLELGYFNLARLVEIDPGFVFPGYVFNTGQLVATTGLLKRVDFEPHVEFDQPPRLRRPDVFRPGEQGLLNYVLMRKHSEGALELGRDQFMKWPPSLVPGDIEIKRLTQDSPYPYLLHWAGAKRGFFQDTSMRHLLEHFERLYYARTPATRAERVRLAAERLLQARLVP